MNTYDPTNAQSRSRHLCIPLCWALLIAFDVILMALKYAPEGNAGMADPQVQSVATEIPGPDDVAADVRRFEAIDVFVDSGNQRLAAWQLEVRSAANDVQIVGIEGG